jgi:hypothetical protein
METLAPPGTAAAAPKNMITGNGGRAEKTRGQSPLHL